MGRDGADDKRHKQKVQDVMDPWIFVVCYCYILSTHKLNTTMTQTTLITYVCQGTIGQNITDTDTLQHQESMMSVKEKVLGDITNEQAETEGPRRSRRSLNRKGAEAASKDERTSFDQNNNTGQVEDGLFKDVSIQGVVGSKRGRGRLSGRGGGKGLSSNRSGKGKWLPTRPFGIGGLPARQIDSLSRQHC